MGHCYQGLPAKVKLKNKLNYILTPSRDTVRTAVERPDTAGLIRLMLYGQKGQRYVVETSPDLRTWSDWRILTNTTGTIFFQDQANAQPARFYRMRQE